MSCGLQHRQNLLLAEERDLLEGALPELRDEGFVRELRCGQTDVDLRDGGGVKGAATTLDGSMPRRTTAVLRVAAAKRTAAPIFIGHMHLDLYMRVLAL